jgi:hypothetical protein
MKKLLLATAVCTLVALSAAAQGTVDFRNRITGTLDVPVYGLDGVTKLGDANYVAQLYFAATQTGPFAAVTDAASVFRTGTGAGYWNAGADSTRTLAGIAGGASVWLQVRVWDSTKGTSFETAQSNGSLVGQSAAFSITAGGGGSPPGPPNAMIGMTSFSLVPEPSTLALLGLGLGALLIRRRK